MKISIVIPVYNEEGNIFPVYRELKKILPKISKSFEIIFVDDGSNDDTYLKLSELSKTSKRIKVISFSRNFGQMAAVEAGLQKTTGDIVALMDADLQDPPKILLKMYKKIQEGFDVVYGVKKNRKENKLRVFLFTSFYKIFDKITQYNFPLDAGTYSMMNRKIVDLLVDMPEKNKYISGLRSWAGYKQTGIIYARDKRYSGKQATYSRLFRLALDGIFSFSYLPLRLASILGFATAFLSLISILFVIFARFYFNFGIIGWASTMSAILLFSGVQLITLGIIGEYLARIYDEVKGRPKFIIKDQINF